MTRNKVRYYLHNLDGLKQEIADINADLEQYRAMQTDEFITYRTIKAQLRQDTDRDPYLDTPDSDGSQHQKYNSHSNVESMAISRADFIGKLEQDLFNLKTILAAINCVLYYLNGWERTTDKKIIQLRYKEHKPWGVMAKIMSYDVGTLKNKDCKIIDEVISNYNARM